MGPNPKSRSAGSRWYWALTPEQRAAYIERVKARQRALTPEKKAEYQERHRARRAAMPEDAKEAVRAAQRAAYAAAKAALRQQEKPPAPGSRVAKEAEKKARDNARRKEARDALQAEITDLKRTRGCAWCGEREPDLLHFHHRDARQKVAEVSQLRKNRDRAAVMAEIAKCDLLCASCHAHFHFQQRAHAALL